MPDAAPRPLRRQSGGRSGTRGSVPANAQSEIAKRDARYARYCELRDDGAYPVDAAREIGIGIEARQRYERAYKAARGIPGGLAAPGNEQPVSARAGLGDGHG
jgi:hypothetical protein